MHKVILHTFMNNINVLHFTIFYQEVLINQPKQQLLILFCIIMMLECSWQLIGETEYLNIK